MYKLVEINLLPWREKKREDDKRNFIISLAASVFISVMVMYGYYLNVENQILSQEKRNNYLNAEIKILDKRIGELRNIETQKDQLLNKLETLYRLRVSRPLSVSLIESISDTIPDSALLTEVSKKGNILSIKGKAKSNSRVSIYMRTLKETGLFSDINLKIVKSGSDDEDNEFELTTTFKKVKKEEE